MSIRRPGRAHIQAFIRCYLLQFPILQSQHPYIKSPPFIGGKRNPPPIRRPGRLLAKRIHHQELSCPAPTWICQPEFLYNSSAVSCAVDAGVKYAIAMWRPCRPHLKRILVENSSFGLCFQVEYHQVRIITLFRRPELSKGDLFAVG